MAELWGLESRFGDGQWLTYYALYPSRLKAQEAANNGRPSEVEWRVVEYRKVTPSDATTTLPCNCGEGSDYGPWHKLDCPHSKAPASQSDAGSEHG